MSPVGSRDVRYRDVFGLSTDFFSWGGCMGTLILNLLVAYRFLDLSIRLRHS